MLRLVNIYSEIALLTRYEYPVSNINYVCVMVMKYKSLELSLTTGTVLFPMALSFIKVLKKDNSVLEADKWKKIFLLQLSFHLHMQLEAVVTFIAFVFICILLILSFFLTLSFLVSVQTFYMLYFGMWHPSSLSIHLIQF